MFADIHLTDPGAYFPENLTAQFYQKSSRLRKTDQNRHVFGLKGGQNHMKEQS